MPTVLSKLYSTSAGLHSYTTLSKMLNKILLNIFAVYRRKSYT